MSTKIRTITSIGIINQTGYGVPTHDTTGLTYFTNLDNGDSYQNTGGTWILNDYVHTYGDIMTGPLFVDSNLIVTGNLFVSGTTTTIDTKNLTITDNLITINISQNINY